MANLQEKFIPLLPNQTRLTQIGEPFYIGNRKYIMAQCECGNTTQLRQYCYLTKRIKSCGCYEKDLKAARFYTHGETKTHLYGVWKDMKQRCYNKNAPNYKDYGGRGIKMCDEWLHSYITFRDWAIANKWQKGLQVDRLDNDGYYTPSNCRITTAKVNSRNKRSSVFLSHEGKTMILVDWADFLGVKFDMLRHKYRKGLRGVELFGQLIS